jgi:hypothetical protein
MDLCLIKVTLQEFHSLKWRYKGWTEGIPYFKEGEAVFY